MQLLRVDSCVFAAVCPNWVLEFSNKLAASAASPDYLKFNVLFKIFGGLVPRFVSLSRKLRFWFSDATFRRPSQQKAKILVLRCSFWSTVSAF